MFGLLHPQGANVPRYLQPAGPLPPLQQQQPPIQSSPEPRQSPEPPRVVMNNPAAVHRGEWATKYAHLPLPPPPPTFYTDRDEMVKDAKNWAQQHGYNLVIGHSSQGPKKSNRLWLVCANSGTYKNKHGLTPETRKRNRTSRKIDCPMRLSASKRRYDEGWLLVIKHAEHNHGPVFTTEDPPGDSPFPELEENLFQWHQQCLAQGLNIHGNAIKAKAAEFYTRMPMYNGTPTPDFDAAWLNNYRRRHGLPARPKPGHHMQMLNDGSNSASADGPSMDNDQSAVLTAPAAPPPQPLHPALDELAYIANTFTDVNLFTNVKGYVKNYMSKYDSSHDWNHILRVLSLANRILSFECSSNPASNYSAEAVYLAALCHDVGDKKYIQPNQDPSCMIADLLLQHGAPDSLALKVQQIATYVSYTTESANPRLTRAVLSQHPELGIVQDADRLDALGAVGIGRAFTFGGVKRPQEGMQGVIDHFGEKLEKLEAMMKTEGGRRMARERTQRIKLFKQWWEEETGMSY